MKFTDFVSTQAIRAELTAEDKPGVIRELAEALKEAGKIAANEVDSVVKAVMKREELGSTGIGRGVAVPHTKHPSVDRLVGTVGVSPVGRRFRQPRRREGAALLPVDFPAGSAGRSFAGLGKYFAAVAR